MNRPLSCADLEHVFVHCDALWQEFRQARIFITGGTGFFGCWLLETLAWANARLSLNVEIVVLSRGPAAFSVKMAHLLSVNPWIHLLQGDVRDFVYPTGEFSHVIHAATEASALLNGKDPLHMLDVIIKGTQHTLDFAMASKAKKVLLVSSGAVYGQQLTDLVKEDSLTTPDIGNPANAYAIAKRTAEHIAVLYSHQQALTIKIARCFAFVGPHLPIDRHFAIGNFIGNALKGEPIHIKGDGSAERSYQYAADLSVWLWHILCVGENNRPYNVGSDQAVSIKALAELVATSVEPPLAVVVTGAKSLPQRYVPSIARAKQELGLFNTIDLNEAIKRTIAWYK